MLCVQIPGYVWVCPLLFVSVLCDQTWVCEDVVMDGRCGSTTSAYVSERDEMKLTMIDWGNQTNVGHVHSTGH